MAKIASKFESNSPKDFAVANMDELAGCRNVKTKADLYSLPKSLLSKSKENTDNDAIGLIWYVLDEGKDYRLTKWIGEELTWEEVKVSGESSNIKVLDTLESQSITDALSANLGYILNQSKADKSELEKYLPKGNYLTEHQSLKDYATKLEVTNEINQKFETINSSNVIYLSTILDKELVTPNDLGGIKEGTKISDLEGKTLSELWDDMLFPTIYPTFTNPSANLNYKGNDILKVHSEAPTSGDFSMSFNRGTINLNKKFQNPRSGNILYKQSFIYYTSEDIKELPKKISLGPNKYGIKVFYEQGPQPKDSKNNNYGTPLPAGSVFSNEVIIYGTYPIYGTNNNVIPYMKELPLIKWNSSNMLCKIINIVPTALSSQCFKIPRQLKTIKELNTISGKYEEVDKRTYTETTESIDINGELRQYYVYTYNGSNRSTVSIEIQF